MLYSLKGIYTETKTDNYNNRQHRQILSDAKDLLCLSYAMFKTQLTKTIILSIHINNNNTQKRWDTFSSWMKAVLTFTWGHVTAGWSTEGLLGVANCLVLDLSYSAWVFTEFKKIHFGRYLQFWLFTVWPLHFTIERFLGKNILLTCMIR